jgi:alpha-tubulin suppressor-like RCC1 family protein
MNTAGRLLGFKVTVLVGAMACAGCGGRVLGNGPSSGSACVPKSTQCFGSTPQTCDGKGTWQNQTACGGSTPECKNGACVAVAAAGGPDAGANAMDGGSCSAGACKKALAITAGDGQTCAVLSGGAVECWGDNQAGELGNGTTTSSSPYAIPTPGAVLNLVGVTAMAAGAAHTCGLLAGGTVECWGYNQHGELGNGTTTSSAPYAIPTPVAVSNLAGVTAIAAGSHACALLSSGAVECWGDNRYGALGNVSGQSTIGSAYYSPMPVPVLNLTGATAIAAGSSHTCALLSDGTVKCWGFNDNGELGDGTTNGSITPVAVSNLTGVTAIGSGTYHTCAIVSGGGVECWGENDYGQLGNGASSLTPVAVSNLNGATAIAAGRGHTCALLSDGTVECWGSDQYGELGNGTSGSSSSAPVVVSNLGRASAIVAGSNHTCALLSGGTVQCWGLNDSGQLGNGTTTNSSTPVHVPL